MEKFFAWVVTGGTGVNGLREKRTVLLVQFRVLASRIGSKSCSCSHWLIQKNVLSDGFCSHCKRAVRAVTNSDFWAHTAPLFSKLKILDIFQINTLNSVKFMFCYHNNLLPPLFLNMTQEQPVIIAFIPVARISRNSQFFTKDPGSGTVFLPLLPICQAFLLSKTKC